MKIEEKDIYVKSAEIISELGLENFSMGELARELGINKASLYYYVKSKDEIIENMHAYFHSLLLKRGYRIDLAKKTEENLFSLVKHWEGLFFSDEFIDYLRALLVLRVTDERAREEWRSLSLTMEGQAEIILDKDYKNKNAGPLFSSLLELNLEKALINGEGEELSLLAPSFIAFLSH